MRLLVLLLLTFLAGCRQPSPSSYIASSQAENGQSLGTTATDEKCVQQVDAAGSAAIYCNDWSLPAGGVRYSVPVGPVDLASLATAGAWRQGLELRFECNPPEKTELAYTRSAMVLRCKRRIGGWPQVGLIARIGDKIFYADGITPLLPVLERSIGVLSGNLPVEQAPTTQPSLAVRRLIERLSARAFTVGNVADYDRLMALGARANLSEDFAAAAEAYRGALKLQEGKQGAGNSDAAVPAMSLALQLSNEGRFPDAAAMFQQAGQHAAGAADQATLARLTHYRALDLINQEKTEAALPVLAEAEAAYTELVPKEALTAVDLDSQPGDVSRFPSQRVLTDPVAQSALMGLIEVRRYRAIALRKLRRPEDARDVMRGAERLAIANAMVQPIIGARVARTAAEIDADRNEDAASARRLQRASADFRLALPLSRPFAATELLRARRQLKAGDVRGTLERCRAALAILRQLKLGIDTQLLEPCMAAFAEAAGNGAGRQAMLAEMFSVAELAQSSVTSHLISQASVRLGTSDKNIADAIRNREDAKAMLGALYAQRDALIESRKPDGRPYNGPPTDAATLDIEIGQAIKRLEDKDGALQQAAPNYEQLLQEVVPAERVFDLLQPGEVLSLIVVETEGTWTFLLRDRQIFLGRSDTGHAVMAKLVQGVRKTLHHEPDDDPPPFDVAGAHAIYAATLGTVEPQLSQAKALVVVPSGPLFSLPFAVLLTGDVKPGALENAPWLVRRMSIAHDPSPANFVQLRSLPDKGRAPLPWIGFGDFRPVSRAVASRFFPGPACAETVDGFASLRHLRHSREELDAARTILGAGAGEMHLGSAFTAEAVRRASMKEYRIVHFSTHALLPSEFACQPDQIIVTSAPDNARTADTAMLTDRDALSFHLNADAVILSACNSGGRGDTLTGEALSALARAFFYADSRALLATHWNLDDSAGARLVAEMLRVYASSSGGGLTEALRSSQLALIAAAGHGNVSETYVHPFYWASMALIGETGGENGASRTVAAR